MCYSMLKFPSEHVCGVVIYAASDFRELYIKLGPVWINSLFGAYITITSHV